MADWSDEETDNPLYADDRNFCKVENRVSIGAQSGPRIGIQEGPHLSTL